MKYIAKPVPTQAIQLDIALSYEKWGGPQSAKIGDWLLSKAGETYTCEAVVFASTYRPLACREGWFYKRAEIDAEVALVSGTIKTIEGESSYEAGDFIITNPGGDQYCIGQAEFGELYTART